MRSERLDLIIPVWGNWHLKVFADKALPTILHESNLPAMAAALDVRVIIYTREAGETMLASLTPRLESVCEVVVQNADMPRGYKDAWGYGFAQSRYRGALSMLVAPDIVWSAGSFAHIAALISEGGRRLVYMPHMRGLPETFAGETLSGEAMLRAVKAHPHPVNLSEEVTSKVFTLHPEMVLWPIAGGWIARLFAREPLVLDPARMLLNSQNLLAGDAPAEGLALVESSDAACGVSLAPRERESHFWNRDGVHEYHPDRLARFTKKYDSAVTRALASRTTLLRYGEIDAAELEDNERKANAAVERAFGPVLSGPKPPWPHHSSKLNAPRAWR
jgi:hypothetical protein